MTATQLMDYLASVLAGALPGWQVYPYPIPDASLSAPTVELGLGASSTADWRLQGPGVQETLLIAMSVPAQPHPDRYRQLIDARDAVVRAIERERAYLLTQGVEVGPPGVQVGALEAPVPVAYADQSQGWRLTLAVQVRRAL